MDGKYWGLLLRLAEATTMLGPACFANGGTVATTECLPSTTATDIGAHPPTPSLKGATATAAHHLWPS